MSHFVSVCFCFHQISSLLLTNFQLVHFYRFMPKDDCFIFNSIILFTLYSFD